MTLPVVEPPFEESDAIDNEDARVAGVLLAAGTSSRFGESNKLLASIEGAAETAVDRDPLVRHAARTLLDATEVDAVAVVVGHDADRVRNALAGLDVKFVENPDAERGQATSVRAGAEWARECGVDGVLFALGDMPRVRPASVDRLVAAYRSGAGDALAAACDGSRGNPVLFDSRHFDALADVDGDTGGREILLDGDNSALVETGDSGVLVDVDTEDDLEAVQ